MIRASVPKLNLDDAFEQKNEIAKAVEDELEKVRTFLVMVNTLYGIPLVESCSSFYLILFNRLCLLMDMKLFRHLLLT